MAVKQEQSSVGHPESLCEGSDNASTLGPVPIDLSPTAYAPLIARVVDRVFPEFMVAVRSSGGRDLVLRHGGPAAVGYLIEFRTKLSGPGASVSADQFAAVCRYRDLDAAREALLRHAEHGTVAIGDDGTFRATERGHEFLDALYALHGDIARKMWSAFPVGRLNDLVERALDSVSPGLALAAMTPCHYPAGTYAGAVLANNLGTIRYHRADAHAAAWRDAGLTADQITAMPLDAADPGGGRTRIEEETNRGAAAAWTALTEAERLELLAGLGALPCSG
jgi:hypothetical protein